MSDSVVTPIEQDASVAVKSTSLKLIHCLRAHCHWKVALLGLVLLCSCTTQKGACPGLSTKTSTGKEIRAGDELASHVAFLSQPALKGRKSDTAGSRLARKYIETRFKECGLIPWGKATGYAQSYRFGKNIVGVLPGTDPNLMQEIVLLSAHYDHLGKVKGKIHPGAGDNASGVAVLLETARELSQPAKRPRRSVAFIAFDGEEKALIGSIAFTCREDSRQANIKAVVNLDMLGREFMDVIRNTLFVTGTEEYPDLRGRVCEFGTSAGMRMLPIGSDLLGPVSDHVPFESLGVPCLFFTCGTFRDYHKPTDTAEKLNYDFLDRSARVISQTVRELADAKSSSRMISSDGNGDLEELRTITTVLTEVMENSNQAGIKESDMDGFNQLKLQAQKALTTGRYDRRTREDLSMNLTGTLVPYLPSHHSEKQPNAKQKQESLMWTQAMQLFYLNHRNEIMAGYRDGMAHVLKHRPGLFRGMPKFEREIYDIAGDDIRVTETGPNTYALDALVNNWTVCAEVKRTKWLVNSFKGGLTAHFSIFNCEGTREQLADYCLLLVRNDQDKSARVDQLKKLVQAVSGRAPIGPYRELLAARIKHGGFKDETDWLVNCILTGTPRLAQHALWAAGDNLDERLSDATCTVTTDPSQPSDVRASAIRVMVKQRERKGLLAVCSVLNDVTPVQRAEYNPMLDSAYPFADRLMVKILRSYYENESKQSGYASQTLGDLAQSELKKATKVDFGKDAAQWRNWIERNIK